MDLKQLDIVYITSTAKVKYLSAPKDREVTPKGLWTVAAIIGDDVLITKDKTVVLIPSSDVLKAMDNHVDCILNYLKGDNHVKGKTERH